MLCHRQAMPSISSYSASPACHSLRNTPAFSHSRNRLWMALALPKRSAGSAFHWQPVRSTYTIASNTSRGSFGLRPPPGLRANFLRAGRAARSGTSGSTRAQNASETSHESNLAFAIHTLRPAHRRERTESVHLYLRISPKGHMRTRPVVVAHPDLKDRSQVRRRDRNHPVQTLASDCSDQPLADPIDHGIAYRGLQNPEAEPLDRFIQAFAKMLSRS